MSTTYTIMFKNNRSEDGRYGVFTSPPEINTSAEVYSNVWMTYNVPALNGTFQINTSLDFYAWVGTAPESPTPGTIVQTGDSALAQLGSKNAGGSVFPMVVKDGEVSLDINQETRTAQLGAFEIDTGTDFNIPNTKYLLGLGKVNKIGLVAPTACILADNNSQTSLTPVVKFYIAESSYKAGAVVQFSSATKDAAEIDFTSPAAKGMYSALVEHEANGSFTVTFEDSVSMSAILAEKAAINKSLVPISDSSKLRQLQIQLQALNKLLETLGIAGNVGSPLRWLAKVGWPKNTDGRIVTAGATAIGLAMIGMRYGCTHEQKTMPDGTVVSTFKISADHKLEDEDVKADWTTAVAADKAKDRHFDMGIVPVKGNKQVGGGQSNGQGSGFLKSEGHRLLQQAQEDWVC